MMQLGFHKLVVTVLAALVAINLCNYASATVVGYTEGQLLEKRKEHARIVAILSALLDGLTSGENREVPQIVPPSPPSTSPPSTSPPSTSPPPTSPPPTSPPPTSPPPTSPPPSSPAPSSPPPSSSPSPRPAAPPEAPPEASPEAPSALLSPSKEEEPEPVVSEDAAEAVEEAPSKPGAIKISGVPYAVFDHEAPSGKAENAVILLHDVDGEANDMVPIMEAIRAENFPNTRFLIPEANPLYVTPLEAEANSWFDPAKSSTNGGEGKEAQLKVVSYIDKIGNHLVDQGIGRDRIVVIGHGQGSNVALTTYLRNEWGGMLGIAGSLSMADSYPSEMSEGSMLAPGVLVSGDQDKVVQVDAMRTSAAKLEELGRDVTYMEIDGEGHDVISNERVPALAVGLLNRVLAIF